MNTNYDLPNEAFTESERAAGVPNMVRGSGWRRPQVIQATVTEADCVSLLWRSLLGGTFNSAELVISHADENEGDDFNLWHLRQETPQSAGKCAFRIACEGYEVPLRTLIGALRTSGLPYVRDKQWLAWSHETQSLDCSKEHNGGHLKRMFWNTGLNLEMEWPSDPESASLVRLLRTSYLTSDFGKRPLLLRNEDVLAALAKRSVPFEEPYIITPDKVENFSLVYFTRRGEVESVPLSKAYDHPFTVATRAGSFFRHTTTRGTMRPSFTQTAMRVNAFELAIKLSSHHFKYFLRRNSGTVFQSIFEQVDMPSNTRFWDPRPERVAQDAASISAWALERNAKAYITTGNHPLHSDDCVEVTTPNLYAKAVQQLAEAGVTLGNSNGRHVDVISSSHGLLTPSKRGLFGDPWRPASSQDVNPGSI